MEYEEIIQKAEIVLGLEGPMDVTARLVDSLVDAGLLPADLRDAAVEAVRARETTGACTALTNGVAIPHARFEPLKEMRVAIGVHPAGLDCGAVDGMPSKIFILVLSSPEQPGVHLKFLGEITMRLLRPAIRENILIASSPEDVRALLLTVPL